jgi:hypothetical protein
MMKFWKYLLMGVYSKLGGGGVRRLISMSLHCEEYFFKKNLVRGSMGILGGGAVI